MRVDQCYRFISFRTGVPDGVMYPANEWTTNYHDHPVRALNLSYFSGLNEFAFVIADGGSLPRIPNPEVLGKHAANPKWDVNSPNITSTWNYYCVKDIDIIF